MRLFRYMLLVSGLVLLCMGCAVQMIDQAQSQDGDHAAGTDADTENRDALGGAGKVDFVNEVLPILSGHCFACHGPDRDSRQAQQAGFRLDIREEAVGFEMIVPGDPDVSPLIDVLTTDRASRRMPPLDVGKPQLKPEQVDLLKRWIAEGASYSIR